MVEEQHVKSKQADCTPWCLDGFLHLKSSVDSSSTFSLTSCRRALSKLPHLKLTSSQRVVFRPHGVHDACSAVKSVSTSGLISVSDGQHSKEQASASSA